MDAAVSAITLRIIIAAIGVLLLVAIYLRGRLRPPGQRIRAGRRKDGGRRLEPVIGGPPDEDAGEGDNEMGSPHQGELDVALKEELDRLGASVVAERGVPAGERADSLPVDCIVTLFLVAHHGERFRGSDIVVAAEKAGLRFGAMRIFHRLVDGHPDAGPVFSMANMIKPGSFDMDGVGDLQTPGLTFFITLPGPVAALDAWETMLPAAQRIASLLRGDLLDEDRNALGRQRIAGLREELRGWDRQHEGSGLGAPPPG